MTDTELRAEYRECKRYTESLGWELGTFAQWLELREHAS